MKSNKYKFRFLLALAGLVILVVTIYISDRNSTIELRNIQYGKIISITLYDRGMLGNRRFNLVADSIVSKVGLLIKNSRPINREEVNRKASLGLCELDLTFFDGKTVDLLLVNTANNGGVLIAGNNYYRNDELLVFVMDILEGGQDK